MAQQRSRHAEFVQVGEDGRYSVSYRCCSVPSPTAHPAHLLRAPLCPALRLSTSAWTQSWIGCPHFRCEEVYGH